MKIGIIGCGLIGRKRALAIEKEDEILACCDVDEIAGKKFASDFNCNFYSDYKDLILKSNCEVIIVSVINKYTKEITEFALGNNKNVLVEKPLGRNYQESLEIINKNKGRILKVGFNHRFHPAIWKAKLMFDSGKIGKLIFIRGYYGHGGRPGMEKEWRASKDLCGGGELLDQGVHLIDLSRWFAGEIKSVFGKVSTKFWDIEVEDNAFILASSKSGADIQIHVSWTNWKNNFQFELYGTEGYLKITGLGGWYGEEKLEIGIRKKEGGVPNIEFFNFPEEDISWKEEWKEFKSAIKENRKPIGNEIDGMKANQIVGAVYESSLNNKLIELE